MANYTPKRKYTKKTAVKTASVKKSPVVAEPVKEPSLIEKAVSWVKNLIK